MTFLRKNKWFLSFVAASVLINTAIHAGSMIYLYPYPAAARIVVCLVLGALSGAFGYILDHRSQP